MNNTRRYGLKLFSTNFDSYYDEVLRLYQEGWFAYIELYVVPGSVKTLPKWKQLRIPYIIHNAHSGHGFNLADKMKRRENRSVYLETRRFADELSAPYILFHGGVGGIKEEVVEQLQSFHETRALIENKPKTPLSCISHEMECRGADYDELAFFMANTGCGFCLDFVHAICAANAYYKIPESFIGRLCTLSPKVFHLSGIPNFDLRQDAHPLLRASERSSMQDILKYIPLGAFVTCESEKKSADKLDDFVEDLVWISNLC